MNDYLSDKQKLISDLTGWADQEYRKGNITKAKRIDKVVRRKSPYKENPYTHEKQAPKPPPNRLIKRGIIG